MLLRFLKSKLFLLFSVILFSAFIVGYDYAVVTSREPSAASSGKPAGIHAPAAKTADMAPETTKTEATASEATVSETTANETTSEAAASETIENETTSEAAVSETIENETTSETTATETTATENMTD